MDSTASRSVLVVDGDPARIARLGRIVARLGFRAVAADEGLRREAERRERAETSLALSEARLDALLKLSESADRPEDELNRIALEGCVSLTRSGLGYLHYVNDAEDGFISYVWSEGSEDSCGASEPMDFSLNTAGIWADSLKYRKPVIHNDYLADRSERGLPPGHIPITRIMTIPVMKRNRVIAVCGVANKDLPYDDTDMRQLLLFMNRLWGIIEVKRSEIALAKANVELRRLATTDPLAGIANRRSLDEFLATQVRLCARVRSPLALLIADIDSFKAYNDAYGHQAGDEVIRRVAAVLGEAARRPTDLAARYGGEEFVVALPNTDADGALLVARGAVEAVRGLGIAHERSGAKPWITVSIGVGVIVPSSDDSLDALLRSADRALYEAKGLGKDTVVLGKAEDRRADGIRS